MLETAMPYKISTTRIDNSNGMTHQSTLDQLAFTNSWASFYAKIYEYTATSDAQGLRSDDQADVHDPASNRDPLDGPTSNHAKEELYHFGLAAHYLV
jgi:hypothetical protein